MPEKNLLQDRGTDIMDLSGKRKRGECWRIRFFMTVSVI